MTTVTIFKRADGFITGYRARGHAGSGKYGNDIVCAAISVLVQSTGDGIVNVVKARAHLRIDEDSGFYELILDENQESRASEGAQILLKTFENAITAIAKDREYSDYVRMNYTERR